MIHQLRIYEVFEHNKSAFHARFRDHAMRIMKKHGFEFVALWEASDPGRTEFVYLLAWPDEEWLEVTHRQNSGSSLWTLLPGTSSVPSGGVGGGNRREGCIIPD